jgi:hypothetical protein
MDLSSRHVHVLKLRNDNAIDSAIDERAIRCTTPAGSTYLSIVMSFRHSGPQGKVVPLTIIEDPSDWTAESLGRQGV